MNRYSLTHLSDQILLRDLAAAAAHEHDNTAVILAHLAEVDARKLYLPAAHPSLYSYCIHELHMSEDSACKRIRAARAARQFPAIFAAVAEGRLHLTAVLVLAPWLTPENVDELLAAATHQSKAEIERLIAERSPRPDLPTGVEALSLPSSQVAATESSAPGRIELSAPERITTLDPQPEVAPRRLALHAMIRPSAHDKLRYAQELLSHQIEKRRGRSRSARRPRPGSRLRKRRRGRRPKRRPRK